MPLKNKYTDWLSQKIRPEDVCNLKTPKHFNSKKARSLNLKDRIQYLKENVPTDNVIEFQIANVRSLSNESLVKVPEFIGTQKERGHLVYKEKTQASSFR